MIVAPSSNQASFGLQVGDEITRIDDRAVLDYLPSIEKYFQQSAPLRNLSNLVRLVNRPAWMTELIPPRAQAKLEIRKKGTQEKRNILIPWTKTVSSPEYLVGGPTFAIPKNEAKSPFYRADLHGFLTSASAKVAKYLLVGPEDAQTQRLLPSVQKWSETVFRDSIEGDYLKRQNQYSAGLLSRGDKTYLLVRISSFVHSSYGEFMLWLTAVLATWEPHVHGLILDMNHNSGGSNDLAHAVIQLFKAKNTTTVSYLYRTSQRSYRRLISWAGRASQSGRHALAAELMAAANDTLKAAKAGAPYSQGMNTQGSSGATGIEYQWDSIQKPVLILVQNRSVSNGDVVPLLLQQRGAAKVFGEPTAGAIGSAWEGFSLPVSQVPFVMPSMAIVLVKPEDSELTNPTQLLEEKSVQPDFTYVIDAKDVEDGFTNYLKSMLDKMDTLR